MSVASTAQFADQGYLLVRRLFDRWQCARVLRTWRAAGVPPSDWDKGHAVTNRALFDIAAQSEIVERVRPLIGEDIVLWGASLLERKPGAVHPWHSDLESSAVDGRTVSVWIGLDGVNRGSSLHVIAGSHRMGQTAQQVSRAHGARRGEADENRLLEWARQIEPACELVHPDMADGDAMLFDGRLWHGSVNANARASRFAMLVQFAAPDTPIRIPNLSRDDEHDRFYDAPLPACILVSGGSDHGRGCANRIVPPPARGIEPQLGCRVHTFDLPEHPGDEDNGWARDLAFHGGTPLLKSMSCHASLLGPDEVPHPPHVHDEEEILIVFEGELDLVLVDDIDGRPQERRHRLSPGRYVYYPVNRRHTLHNPGTVPAKYMMFKWKSHGVDGRAELDTTVVDYQAVTPGKPNEHGMHAEPLMHAATAQLRWIHSHFTTVQQGGGYEPHADAYDVALVTIEGEIETLGRRVPPQSVVYCPAGELHGLRNVGSTPARYLVFEFHATMAAGIPKLFPRLRRHLRPLKHRVKRLIRNRIA